MNKDKLPEKQSDKLHAALNLASQGFRVFPLVPNGKIPVKDMHYPEEATTNEEQIKKWWSNGHANSNIGISTNNLLAIDVDNKGVKKGDEELCRLEINDNLVLPTTYEQTTPTGGRHIVYSLPEGLNFKNSVCKLGPGLDTRAERGYIVGAGSTIGGKKYTSNNQKLSEIPKELAARLVQAVTKAKSEGPTRTLTEINYEAAIERAKFYLENEAPLSLKGQGGDQTCFAVAAKVKDFGVSPDDCLRLMLESSWHSKSGSSWTAAKLKVKIANAYRYGENSLGAASPEAVFTKIEEEKKLSPIEELNKEYAYTVMGGKSVVLHETVDAYGEPTTHFMLIEAFKNLNSSKTITYGKKTVPLAPEWLSSEKRRTYKGVYFYPGSNPKPSYYNLWRGFGVEPQDMNKLPANYAESKAALDAFLEHVEANMCDGDAKLYHWLINFCAHIIQKPEIKPMVALVFRGEKGVGKNFFVDQIGSLFKNNYIVTADDRYLTGNFNSHLEQCLLMVLDEAFWSGNKKADGLVKSLITERNQVIERKGKEAYKAKNFTRVCILGNNDWLIPASNDERRFAVFDVGSGRKQDNTFFASVRQGMKNGGQKLLMRYLTDFKLDVELVNKAPQTKGLSDQKEESLQPVHVWWLECLHAGKIVGSNFSEDWPSEVPQDAFWDAYQQFITIKKIHAWGIGNRALGKLLRKCLKSLDSSGKKMVEGRRFNIYRLPSLEKCRNEWGVWSGSSDTWGSSDTSSDISNLLI